MERAATHLRLHNLQRARKAVILAGIVIVTALMLTSLSRWPGGTLLHEAIEWVGIFLLVVAILGRTWCSLYIGGRKIAHLVAIGPYSVTRNPLYVLSVIGTVGAGAQAGSIVIALALGLTAYLVFSIVILKEEEALRAMQGVAYEEYCKRVPRFFPKLALWQDVPKLEIITSRMRVTFFDGLFFLLAIPIAEGIEYLHELGILPTLFYLP